MIDKFSGDYFRARTETGEYDLLADVIRIGKDILVAVHGGDKPHVGAVALAVPRPSLRHSGKTSASASVLCITGHKEDELAREAAIRIASAMNTRVVVTAGMHWDHITDTDIANVVRKFRMLIDEIHGHLLLHLFDGTI